MGWCALVSRPLLHVDEHGHAGIDEHASQDEFRCYAYVLFLVDAVFISVNVSFL